MTRNASTALAASNAAIGNDALTTQAVVLKNPEQLDLRGVELEAPAASDVVVNTRWSSISTGTERLLYEGKMPPFPGMGYPLVPGYESVGDIVWAGPDSGRCVGDRVFVAGAGGYKEAHALFGGAAQTLVASGDKVLPISKDLKHNAVLLALAATAHHILQLSGVPDLIVGHGILGRLLARLAVSNNSADLTVWETDPARRPCAEDYRVVDPGDDKRSDYGVVIDASGDSNVLDTLIGRLARGGNIVLGGFYSERVSFDFPPAFMREIQLSVAAEFTPEDLIAVGALCDSNALKLDGLITHRSAVSAAEAAYEQAFSDRKCLKMVLDWDELL